MSQCTGKGRACSHQGGLGLGRQSSQNDTCRTEGPLCCAGSSVVRRTHSQFTHTDVTKSIFNIFENILGFSIVENSMRRVIPLLMTLPINLEPSMHARLESWGNLGYFFISQLASLGFAANNMLELFLSLFAPLYIHHETNFWLFSCLNQKVLLAYVLVVRLYKPLKRAKQPILSCFCFLTWAKQIIL